MFCPNCGSVIRADARFCSKCGCDVLSFPGFTPDTSDEHDDVHISSDETAQIPRIGWHPSTEDPDSTDRGPDMDRRSVSPGDTEELTLPVRVVATSRDGRIGDTAEIPVVAISPPQAVPTRHRRKRRGLIVTIIVLVILIAGGIVGWGFFTHGFKTQIAFKVTAPGYNAVTDSKIPVNIQGADARGNPIDEDFYLSSGGSGVYLAKGTYTAKVAASPLLANSTLYDVPASSYTIVIGDNGLDAASTTDLSIVFTITDALDITDSQINAAYNLAVASGFDQDKASQYKSGVVSARQTARDKKAAEEAAAKAAAEKAAAEAAAKKKAEEAALEEECHYYTKYFEFKVPTTWAYKYNVGDPSSDVKASAGKYFWKYLYHVNGYPSGGFSIGVADSSRGDIASFEGDYTVYTVGKTSQGYTVKLARARTGSGISDADFSYIRSSFTLK